MEERRNAATTIGWLPKDIWHNEPSVGALPWPQVSKLVARQGFRIELANAGARMSLATVPLIYQPEDDGTASKQSCFS
jgi:hypothetical protein